MLMRQILAIFLWKKIKEEERQILANFHEKIQKKSGRKTNKIRKKYKKYWFTGMLMRKMLKIFFLNYKQIRKKFKKVSVHGRTLKRGFKNGLRRNADETNSQKILARRGEVYWFYWYVHHHSGQESRYFQRSNWVVNLSRWKGCLRGRVDDFPVAKVLLGFAEGLVMTCILVCFPPPCASGW